MRHTAINNQSQAFYLIGVYLIWTLFQQGILTFGEGGDDLLTLQTNTDSEANFQILWNDWQQVNQEPVVLDDQDFDATFLEEFKGDHDDYHPPLNRRDHPPPIYHPSESLNPVDPSSLIPIHDLDETFLQKIPIDTLLHVNAYPPDPIDANLETWMRDLTFNPTSPPPFRHTEDLLLRNEPTPLPLLINSELEVPEQLDSAGAEFASVLPPTPLIKKKNKRPRSALKSIFYDPSPLRPFAEIGITADQTETVDEDYDTEDKDVKLVKLDSSILPPPAPPLEESRPKLRLHLGSKPLLESELPSISPSSIPSPLQSRPDLAPSEHSIHIHVHEFRTWTKEEVSLINTYLSLTNCAYNNKDSDALAQQLNRGTYSVRAKVRVIRLEICVLDKLNRMSFPKHNTVKLLPVLKDGTVEILWPLENGRKELRIFTIPSTAKKESLLRSFITQHDCQYTTEDVKEFSKTFSITTITLLRQLRKIRAEMCVQTKEGWRPRVEIQSDTETRKTGLVSQDMNPNAEPEEDEMEDHAPPSPSIQDPSVNAAQGKWDMRSISLITKFIIDNRCVFNDEQLIELAESLGRSAWSVRTRVYRARHRFCERPPRTKLWILKESAFDSDRDVDEDNASIDQDHSAKRHRMTTDSANFPQYPVMAWSLDEQIHLLQLIVQHQCDLSASVMRHIVTVMGRSFDSIAKKAKRLRTEICDAAQDEKGGEIWVLNEKRAASFHLVVKEESKAPATLTSLAIPLARNVQEVIQHWLKGDARLGIPPLKEWTAEMAGQGKMTWSERARIGREFERLGHDAFFNKYPPDAPLKRTLLAIRKDHQQQPPPPPPPALS